jgi:nucleotide-binding universal stress UspA family protein
MRRVLVVANQTIGGAELRKELQQRVAAGQCSFYVVVPNTAARHYHVVPAAGGFIPMPAMATSYDAPATDEEATEEARARLADVLAELAELGAQAEGHLGSGNPVEAVAEALHGRQFDEVVVATLPKRVSRWLGSDVPNQIERRSGLPVTTIVSRG